VKVESNEIVRGLDLQTPRGISLSMVLQIFDAINGPSAFSEGYKRDLEPCWCRFKASNQGSSS